MEIVLGIILALLIIFVLFAIDILSWGFVTFKFYHWFILPIFVDLPSIDFYQAVGLCLFISLFKNHNTNNNNKKKDNDDNNSPILTLILTPWIVLLIGYIVKSFI